MTDEEVIRKAVEYAEGWKLGGAGIALPHGRIRLFDDPITGRIGLEQYWLDALAAQLARQAEREPHTMVQHTKWREGKYIGPCCIVSFLPSPVHSVHAHVEALDDDRTMATLRAIVEAAEDEDFRRKLTEGK